MASQVKNRTTPAKAAVLRVMAPGDGSAEFKKFAGSLNGQLLQIADQFSRLSHVENFDPTEYLRKDDLEKRLRDIDERFAETVTSETGDPGDERRNLRTSRKRRRAESAAASSLSGAEPLAAPPEIETAGNIGTTDSTPGPLRFALSDHTHSGVNLNDVQDIAARKDFLGGLFAGTLDQFRIGTDGDVDRIKDVPYSWPAANATGVLSNDGAGVLSWTLSVPGLDADTLDGINSTGFWILAGQAGGQIGIGGTASGNDATIRSNTSDDGRIILGNSITATDSVVIHGTETGLTIGGSLFATRVAIHDQEAADANIAIHKHHATGSVAPTFIGARTRGTEAAETVVADNDVLLRMLAVGFDGTDFERSSQILFEIDDSTPSGTSMGGAITLSTTAAGSTSLTERLRVAADGRVTVVGSGLGVNGLPYVWPASQAASRVLKTDGASTLSWGQVAASEITSGAALTRVDDTNVTLTLGGSPTTALLAATSLTLGWTGLLGLARGGTNANLAATGGASQVLRQSSAGAAVTVSQLAFTDISGSVTDAQVPNTITLDNITQITTRPHASLTGLAADDHAQYLLFAGRAGGQTAYGGTATTDSLTLGANNNAFAAANTGRIALVERLSSSYSPSFSGASLDTAYHKITGTWTFTGTSAFSVPGMQFAPIFAFDTGQVLSSCPALFANQTFRPTAAVANILLTTFTGFYALPVYDIGHASGASSLDADSWFTGYASSPRSSRAGGGTGTATLTNFSAYTAFNSFFVDGLFNVGVGVTATHLAGLHVLNPSVAGGGAITTLYGIRLAALTSGATNISLSSAGTAVSMRHAGAATFGIDAAPDTTNGNILDISRVHTLTGAVGDGQAAGVVLDPGYTGAFTVTRHNYVKYENVSVAASAVVTAGAMAWFDAAIGTHTCLAANGAVVTTFTALGPTGAATTIQGWIRVNINGTIRHIPFW